MDTPAIDSAISQAQHEHNAAIDKTKARFTNTLRRRMGKSLWAELGVQVTDGTLYNYPVPGLPVGVPHHDVYATCAYGGVDYLITHPRYEDFAIIRQSTTELPRPTWLRWWCFRRDLALFLAQQKEQHA